MDVTKTKRMKSIEEKAKAYDEAIKRGLDYIRQTPATEMVTRQSILEHIFPELKESEDEKMIQYFKDLAPFDKAEELYEKYGFSHKDAIAWLEKQAEHANFRNKIQVGDKVTRNEDGVLVNLSQLNRVAKKDEKKGEQKPQRMVSAEVKEAMYDKPAWSEEDEMMLESVLDKIGDLGTGEMCKEWLYSLKDRYTWKPSDEQIDAVKDAIDYLGYNTKKVREYLMSLYEQLKKLMEE